MLAVGVLKVVQPPPQAALVELAAELAEQLRLQLLELQELETAVVARLASRQQAARLSASPVLESEQRRIPEALEALVLGPEAQSQASVQQGALRVSAAEALPPLPFSA